MAVIRSAGADPRGAGGAVCPAISLEHRYAIARDTGLKSGTLYPILVRLADRGLLEACWEDEQRAGRPGGTCIG